MRNPKPGLSWRLLAGIMIIVVSALLLFGLWTRIASAQGLWLPGYGDMAGLETYLDQVPVPLEAQLELQAWQGVPWHKGWLVDSYWLYALWTPSDTWNRVPRLVMFYGQYHTSDVYVLVGDESSHTPTGWHPQVMMIISMDTFDVFHAMIGVGE